MPEMKADAEEGAPEAKEKKELDSEFLKTRIETLNLSPRTQNALTSANILLSNVVANPGGSPCFSYQTETVSPNTYVTAIAVTLSVRTQDIDPVTRQFQIETKTLLNVSPRNVYNTWQLASMSETNRVQPIPPSILVLIQ